MENHRFETLYLKTIDLWQRLCERHSTLFDFTCDENMLLLSSDIDGLEKKLVEKEEVIDSINSLEKIRQELVDELNEMLSGKEKIDSISQLLHCYQSKIESEKKNRHLQKFNDLLVDIIGKVQEQNKKNQIFLNKAIASLKEIREDASGVKSYPLYTSKGGQATGDGAVK